MTDRIVRLHVKVMSMPNTFLVETQLIECIKQKPLENIQLEILIKLLYEGTTNLEEL